jgi:hypothetical protein
MVEALGQEVSSTALSFWEGFSDTVAGGASTVLGEMGEVSSTAKQAELALRNPEDPSSRRVLAGWGAGHAFGHLVTRTPVGGLFGGFVGAGAGGGANEVSKEVALGRTVKDSSLASLPAFRRLANVHKAKEDQGSLPVASPEDVAAAVGPGVVGPGVVVANAAMEGGADAAAGVGGTAVAGGGFIGSSATTAASDTATAVGRKGADADYSDSGGGGDGGLPADVDASDMLIYSVLAGSKPAAADQQPLSSPTSHGSVSRPRSAASGAASGSGVFKGSGGVGATLQEEESMVPAFFSSSITSVVSFSPFGDSGSSSSSSGGDGNDNGGSALDVPLLYNMVNRRYYTAWSTPPKKKTAALSRGVQLAAAAAAGAVVGGPGALSALEPRWAIWTREMTLFVHRYEYASEEEARADFERWVYVRVLTDPQHQEVDARAGWHAAPKGPLRDIRSTINASR